VKLEPSDWTLDLTERLDDSNLDLCDTTGALGIFTLWIVFRLTQPAMYDVVGRLPRVRDSFAGKLVEQGVLKDISRIHSVKPIDENNSDCGSGCTKGSKKSNNKERMFTSWNELGILSESQDAAVVALQERRQRRLQVSYQNVLDILISLAFHSTMRPTSALVFTTAFPRCLYFC